MALEPGESIIKQLGEPVRPKQVENIIGYFPIGERVQYYPEYQTDLKMESVILGYKINHLSAFSMNQIETVSNKKGDGVITVHAEQKEETFAELNSFSLLVPSKAGEEYQLNYPDKASLGNTGQFRNGNAITLIARYQNRGVIMLETIVKESFIAKSGLYQGHQLTVLDVLTTTLEFSEQRNHHRLTTNLPVTIRLLDGSMETQCMLANYSETSVAIRLDAKTPLSERLKTNQYLTLTIKLESLHKTFVIGGHIIKLADDQAVMMMQDILKNGDMTRMQLMDALTIKANLAQFCLPSEQA